MDAGFFSMLLLEKEKQEIGKVLKCNERSGQYGLSLTKEEAQQLVLCRNESLKKHKRVELGEGILDKLIDTFCDSQYLYGDNYGETLQRLQDIFYEFKNESMDKVSDDELLIFMKEQFEKVCYGDLNYLEETCMERFAKAVRKGYRGYQTSGGHGEYEQLSEEQRWDKGLYYETLKELFG